MGNGYSPHSSYSIAVPAPLKPTNEFNLWQSCHFDHGWMGQKTFNTACRELGGTFYKMKASLTSRWAFKGTQLNKMNN